MNERLGAIEQQLIGLAVRHDESLLALERRQDEHFRWLVGIILIQWMTVLAAVLGALLTR